jgi:hypothetical protein
MDPNKTDKPMDNPAQTTPEASKKVKCDKTYQNRRKTGGNAGPSKKAKLKNNSGGEKRGKSTNKRDRPAQSPSGLTPVNKFSKSSPIVEGDKKFDGRNAAKNNTVSTAADGRVLGSPETGHTSLPSGGDGPGLGTPTRFIIPMFKNSALKIKTVEQTEIVSARDSLVKPSLPSGGDGAGSRVTNTNQTYLKAASAILGAAEDSQEEMADLTLQKEKEAVKEIINGVKPRDELDEEKSPSKNPGNGEPDAYFAVLYIHESGTERKPLTQDRFNLVWLKCQERFVQQILQGMKKKICIPWSGWKDDRGMVGCGDKETVEIVKETVSNVKLEGVSFRAWSRGEFGLTNLVTMYIPKSFEGVGNKQLMKVILLQNELRGKYSSVKVEKSGTGRILRFGADRDLFTDLCKTEGCVCLGLGQVTFRINKARIVDLETPTTANAVVEEVPDNEAV